MLSLASANARLNVARLDGLMMLPLANACSKDALVFLSVLQAKDLITPHAPAQNPNAKTFEHVIIEKSGIMRLVHAPAKKTNSNAITMPFIVIRLASVNYALLPPRISAIRRTPPGIMSLVLVKKELQGVLFCHVVHLQEDAKIRSGMTMTASANARLSTSSVFREHGTTLILAAVKDASLQPLALTNSKHGTTKLASANALLDPLPALVEPSTMNLPVNVKDVLLQLMDVLTAAFGIKINANVKSALVIKLWHVQVDNCGTLRFALANPVRLLVQVVDYSKLGIPTVASVFAQM